MLVEAGIISKVVWGITLEIDDFIVSVTFIDLEISNSWEAFQEDKHGEILQKAKIKEEVKVFIKGRLTKGIREVDLDVISEKDDFVYGSKVL